MIQIKLKTLIGILISKAVIKASKLLFKGGTNFPGRIALKIDKSILSHVARGYKVILITGTNGKTTTTNMIYTMLKDSGRKVITNSTGANMLPGIASSFIEAYRFSSKEEDAYAVIEVDEANLTLLVEYIKPLIITITNLFRDQLDRYGEVYTTLKKILDGVEKTPESTLVLNGDESLLGDLNMSNPKVYYGFNCTDNKERSIDLNADAKFCKHCKNPYYYNFLIYNHLGDFYCKECGYKRPDLTFHVDDIIELTATSSFVVINNKEYYINQPGIYNVYNALCAYSIARILEIDHSVVFNALKSSKSSFGRQEVIDVDGIETKIILVKNPAGFDQSINTIILDKDKICLAFLLNDNYADGRDVSWIWDVNFEKMNSLLLNKVIISGIRLYDMAIRLKVSGLSTEKFNLCDNYDSLVNAIKDCGTKRVYILATYTAMINFRKHLHSKGYIKKLW